MIKYLIKKKVEQEAKHIKKVMIYSGVAIVGVGAYVVYKSVKKKEKQAEDDESINYLYYNDEEKYSNNIDEEVEESMKKSIEKINSKRIIDENCEDINQNKITDKIDEMKIEKNKVEIQDYKEGKYDEYDYIQNDLEKDK